MCEKCEALDKKIAHYREIAGRVNDKLVLEGIERLIRNFEAEKREFHQESR